MQSNIRIIEKPDWVSWDDIHKVLWKSHEKNRQNGVFMKYPSLSGEEIKNRIEGNGRLFVAIDNGVVVGTSAVLKKHASFWFSSNNIPVAYFCFEGVLPSHEGQGIFRSMCRFREKYAMDNALDIIMADTNENNLRRLEIAKKAGYKFVDLKFYKDHYNVVMVKWLNGCPYSDFKCSMHFMCRVFVVKLKGFLKH